MTSASNPNTSGVRSLSPAAADRAVDEQELRSNVLRLERVVTWGIAVWTVSGFLDWLAASYIEPARVSVLWSIRIVADLIFVAILLRLRKKPSPSLETFRILNVSLFTVATACVAGMCIEYGGITSPYAHGISCVLIAAGVGAAEPWRRGALTLGIPALAFPVVLLAAAPLSPRISGQLADSRAAMTFVQHVVMIATSWFLLVFGGHVVWQLRRQLFEAREIGRYKLKARIGQGGMGEVWRASHVGLKRDVAVKILRAGGDKLGEAVARFEREVRATTELRHPNTVRIHDYGTTDDGLWFYAMEYLEGETLAALIERDAPLEAQRTIRIALQIARALGEAHEHGIVHRDVKPENVFLTEVAGERDFVKVLDFGIAREIATEPGQTLTRVGSVVGTPAFMAPEQATGASVEPASDVYSLGAVLYKCLTGRAPFDKDNDSALLEAHLTEPPPPFPNQVPPDLEAVVLRCLAKRPDERFANGNEVAEALVGCAVELDPLSRRLA